MAVTPLRRPTWLTLCQLSDGKTPRPLPNLYNALIALRNGDYADAFAYDEMLQAPVIIQSAPQVIADTDVIGIQEWMQDNGLRRIPRATVDDAVTLAARERSFHPIRDWLESLTWDGVRRTNVWLISYCGVAPSLYAQRLGEMFLISMVARIFQPGCKVDHMLILEGEQGIYKSEVCRTLAGQYFSDSLPEIGGNEKDLSLHLRGKWLVEISEMHAFSKAEATHLKSFISRQQERYRPPFGHREVIEPRQVVFIGTSNKDRYLRDETGDRRSWPVKCGNIMVKRLTEVREQLFAEAVHLYRQGAEWWPDRAFQREHIKPEQDARFEADIWTEAIAAWLGNTLLDRVTVRQIAAEVLRIEDKFQDARAEKRIISVLRSEGWKPRHTKSGGVWERPIRERKR
jgi:predicted P-loop ATPase